MADLVLSTVKAARGAFSATKLTVNNATTQKVTADANANHVVLKADAANASYMVISTDVTAVATEPDGYKLLPGEKVDLYNVNGTIRVWGQMGAIVYRMVVA